MPLSEPGNCYILLIATFCPKSLLTIGIGGRTEHCFKPSRAHLLELAYLFKPHGSILLKSPGWEIGICLEGEFLLSIKFFFLPPINNSTLRIWFFGLTIFIASVFSVNGLMVERLQIIWLVSLFCLSVCPELKSIKNSYPMGKKQLFDMDR